MKIYQQEIDLGLKDKIEASTKACFNLLPNPTVPKNGVLEAEIRAKTLPKEEAEYLKKTMDAGLMWVRGILVSTNWNRNDDIFTMDDTWKARYTPRYKPVNMNHLGNESVGNETIGVITNSYTCDDDMNHIWDYSGIESFNIAVEMILWEKQWPTHCAEIKAGIDAGTKFLSIECMFDNFGYGLMEAGSDQVMLLPRHELTAGLTKFLRVFGGSGVININAKEYKIGRWVQEMTVTGGGFVDNPGNFDSILTQDYVSTHKIKKDTKITAAQLDDFLLASVLNLSNKGKIDIWNLPKQ